MPAQVPELKTVRFGVFQVLLNSGELYKAGVKVKLQQQPLQLLVLLLERPRSVVTRDELRAKLWPTETFVDFEHGLNSAVRKIRQALGDIAENPVFIETVPRKGYRFIAPVETMPAVSPTPLAMPSATDPGSTQDDRAGSNSSPHVLLFALVGMFLLAGLGWVLLRDHRVARASAPPIRSLAVLPLQNLSRDTDQDFFADGMTEELITELGRIGALRVISRTSVMQYKGTTKPIQQIARELNVDALLEGTVSRSGNHVRITTNLVQASPEGHLWADSYDTEAADILNVQQRVADSVAREVRVALAPRDPNSSTSAGPVNSEVQDLYFRGIHALRSGAGQQATRSAIDYFQQAIQKDPNFARPYSGLAMAYAVWYPDDPGPRDNMPKAREAARKAVELDESLAAGHMALGYVALNYDWNWSEAEKEFKRALELDPNSANTRDFYSRELVALGRTDEALAQAAQSLELEPYTGLDYPAWVFYLAHHYEDALQLARKMVAMNPNFSWGRWALAANYEQLGKPQEAAEEYLKFEMLSGTSPVRIKRLQDGLAKSGVKGFWRASLDDYRETAKSRYVPPVLFAGTCLRLGDKTCAMAWLEKGFQERDDLMIDLNVDPIFLELHSDPRFQDLLRRVGLPN
jgi:TolB-like protein/DNA-binding winged helix-turn-helix (wHTH) protein/tetratricopeptide (TPR) repeat protein